MTAFDYSCCLVDFPRKNLKKSLNKLSFTYFTCLCFFYRKSGRLFDKVVSVHYSFMFFLFLKRTFLVKKRSLNLVLSFIRVKLCQELYIFDSHGSRPVKRIFKTRH